MTDEVKTATDAANAYFAAVDASAIADPLPEETIDSLLTKLDEMASAHALHVTIDKQQELVASLRSKLNELATAELQIERLKRGKRQRQMYELLSKDRFGGVGPTRRLLALSLVRNALALLASTAISHTKKGSTIQHMRAALEPMISAALEQVTDEAERPDYGVGLASVALMIFAERSGISIHDAELASVNKLHAEISAADSGRTAKVRPTHLANRWPVPI